MRKTLNKLEEVESKEIGVGGVISIMNEADGWRTVQYFNISRDDSLKLFPSRNLLEDIISLSIIFFVCLLWCSN